MIINVFYRCFYAMNKLNSRSRNVFMCTILRMTENDWLMGKNNAHTINDFDVHKSSKFGQNRSHQVLHEYRLIKHSM